MFRKILYPTDFSLHSNKVAESIINLKPAGVGEVMILHIIDKRIFTQFPEVSGDVINTMRTGAEKSMAKVANQLKSAGLKTEAIIEVGVPFHQIVGIAKAEAASMIIMGSHGRSLVEEMLLGSTTENVLRHTTVPLLIEKYDMKKEGDKTVLSRRHVNPFETILYPTDFSECASSVMPYLKQLKGAGIKKIIVAHIQDMSRLSPHLLDRLPEFEDIDSGRLNDIRAELEASGIEDVKTILRDGIPFIEIEAIANEENAGMIVIGSHGRSMVGEMLIGSVSGRISRRSKRPLLIIRRK